MEEKGMNDRVGLVAGGPLKPDFGLSGAVLQPDKVFPPLAARMAHPTASPPWRKVPRKFRNCDI